MIKSLQSIQSNIYKKVFANVLTLSVDYKRLYDIIKQIHFSEHWTCSLSDVYLLIIDTSTIKNI